MALDETKLSVNNFIIYKWLNSFFLGVSIGCVFTIYEPLEPSVYSLGGMALALGVLVIAKFYHKILNATYFFRISLLVEIIVLIMLILFLIFSYSYQIALMTYIGYQLTFMFGSYLVRAETLVFKEEATLTKIDIAKQFGYLVGMALSYGFYKMTEHLLSMSDKQEQVYLIHYLLILIELSVIVFLIRAFIKK